MLNQKNQKTEQKTKTTLDEQIKIAHKVLGAVCGFLVLAALVTFLIPKTFWNSFLTEGPTVSNVAVTQPAFKDKVVFGYGEYVPGADGLPEKYSLYKWYKNSEEIGSGTLSKSFLNHFETPDLKSEEGFAPIDNVGITRVPGKFGQYGVEIKEVGDALSYEMPTRTGFNVNSGTIEMWVKPNWNSGVPSNPPVNGHYLFFEQSDSPTNDDEINLRHWDEEGMHLYIKANGVETHFAKQIIWESDEWHHVAITFGNNQVRFYVDGQSSQIRTYNAGVLGTKFYIGSRPGFPDERFNGVIDEVRLHNKALTSDEVYESFALERAYHSNEQMLELNPSSFVVGDTIKFQYKPCNANGCGDPVTSPEVSVRQFTSTINIDANNVLHDVNKELFGIFFPYGDETNPVDCCYRDCGDVLCKLGSRIWDTTTNAPDSRTVGLVHPLNFGSTKIRAETVSNTNEETDRLVEFTREVGIPDNTNVYFFEWLYDIEQAFDLNGIRLVDYVDNNNLNIDYWEFLDEPMGHYSNLYDDNGQWLLQNYGSEPEMIASVINEYGPAIRLVNSDAKIGGYVVEYGVPQDTSIPRDGIADTFVASLDTLLDLTGENVDFIAPSQYIGYAVPDDNYPVSNFYDNYFGEIESVLETNEWFRNKLDEKYSDKYREIKLVWNLDTRLDYNYDYYQVWHSLLTGLVDASFLNSMVYRNNVDSATFWAWSFGGWGSLVGRNGETSVPYLVFDLYADHTGDKVVNSSVNTLNFDAPGQGDSLQAKENIPSLDVLSTKDSTTNKLYVIVVNRDRLRDLTTDINLNGFNPDNIAKTWTLDEKTGACDEILESRINGPCGWEIPDRSDPFYYGPDNVVITPSQINYASNLFQYTFPEHSITVFEFTSTGGGGTLDLTLSGDSSVPQGGTMNIQVTVENNSSEIQTFDVWFDLTREQTRENIIEPFNDYQLGSGDTGVYEESLGIPSRAQPDTYTLTAYVGPNFKDHDVYEDSASHEFTVTEIPCQFNCQEVTPLEFEIEGSTIRIWREAERATITPPMKRAEDPLASGKAYIFVPNGAGENGMAQYTVSIPQEDKYIIWGRIIAPSSEDDSFWVQMDEGTRNLWNLPKTTTWAWDKVSNQNGSDPTIFPLTQGTHTLYIRQREDGAKLDELLITNDLDYEPSGMGE